MNGRLLIWIMVLAGATAAMFFTVRVQSFKRAQAAVRRTIEVTSGDRITVRRVMDGDEFEGIIRGQAVIVRILGIKSFDPTTDDPRTRSIAGQAVGFLERRLVGKPIVIRFDELKWDTDRRLLAYVFSGNTDVGEEMVRQGLTLVYSRYPFSREPGYRSIQRAAREARLGLWNAPGLHQRALTLETLWAEQRREARP